MAEQTENKGLDNWNKRLDQNLESEKHGDEVADLRAEDFSNEAGSGDQSDDPNRDISAHEPQEQEDNMAKNHPHSANREDKLDREE
ncbi:MAG TPA: hypothetical protein VK541_21860 [Pedobacter sp.]|uniref:hypothetical protein n=1 Tax=Pedobacter sp. TaxID=1411316 RepID=UPI002C1F1F8E|nr:hypothetical protein [Pedobacter sp.]HMI05148.1 hypothetical protein [Pedobacter sp.]